MTTWTFPLTDERHRDGNPEGGPNAISGKHFGLQVEREGQAGRIAKAETVAAMPGQQQCVGLSLLSTEGFDCRNDTVQPYLSAFASVAFAREHLNRFRHRDR